MSLGLTAAGWAAVGAVGATAVSAYGANKAAGAQADAAQQGQQEAGREFDLSRSDTLANLAQTRADQAPFREAGTSALSQIMSGMSDGGQFRQTFDPSQLSSDAGYQFRLNQGTAGLNRAAAATGAGYSGATLKALARFNSGTASDEFNNAYGRFTTDQNSKFNRLASVAGIGQTATNSTQTATTAATGQLNTLGTNYANTNAALLGNLGEARASGYVANSNAVGSGIKSLYNAYQSGPWTTGGGSGSVENVLI